MFRAFMIAAASAAVITLSPTAFAQGQGTADEAKAMLEKTVSALKADKAKTLDLINEGKGGFLDRDLYPFCFKLSDGINVAVASPNSKQVLGTDVRTLKDGTGMLFGPELYAAAQKPEGQITEVSYMWPRAGSDKTPVAKVSFVTKAGDLGCGVGYYKYVGSLNDGLAGHGARVCEVRGLVADASPAMRPGASPPTSPICRRRYLSHGPLSTPLPL